MEVKMNKEIRNYQESMFMGLNLRQCIFSLLAIAVVVGIYFGLGKYVGQEMTGWLCILGAALGKIPRRICHLLDWGNDFFRDEINRDKACDHHPQTGKHDGFDRIDRQIVRRTGAVTDDQRAGIRLCVGILKRRDQNAVFSVEKPVHIRIQSAARFRS